MPDSDEDPRATHDGGDTGDERPDYWSKHNRKVDYLIDKYDLDGIIPEIQSRWERDDDERWGIRRCAKYFNTQILEAVFRTEIGDNPGGYSNDAILELLTGDEDDINRNDRADIRNWFADHGVDPDELADDFVHYRTLFKYFKDVLDAETPDRDRSPDERRSHIQKNVQRSLNQSKASISKEIQRGQNAGALPDAEFALDFRVSIRCHECGTHRRVQEYVEDGGCDCDID
jgi:hypothetical protein